MPFDESQATRTPCTSQTPVIKQFSGSCVTHNLTVRDRDGNAVDLTTIGPCDTRYHGVRNTKMGSSSSSSSTIAVAEDTIEVLLQVSDSYTSQDTTFSCVATILDETTGSVSVKIDTDNSNIAGLFLGVLLVYVNDVIRYVSPYYFEFEHHAGVASIGPITIAEVRMEMYDTCPDANYLIDEFEFTDAEIFHCMKKSVDEWNDALPPVSTYNYRNFPYRSAWLKATSAHLLNMIANKYRRNALDYSSGGVTVRDQWRWKAYQDRARELLQEYYGWVRSRKIAINIAGCDGYVDSDYRWS
jgi:hypothetical protein